MKQIKRILVAVFALCLTLGIAVFAASCVPTPNDNTVDYTVTVTCDDASVLTAVKVQLLNSDGTAATDEESLADGKATFTLEGGTYTVKLTGADDYTYSAATVTTSNPNVTIALTKKDNPNPQPQTVTYTVTVKDSEGNAVVGIIVQLCESGENGACTPAVTDADGKATFADMEAKEYEVHIDAEQEHFPAGHTFDNTQYKVTDKTLSLDITLTKTSTPAPEPTLPEGEGTKASPYVIESLVDTFLAPLKKAEGESYFETLYYKYTATETAHYSIKAAFEQPNIIITDITTSGVIKTIGNWNNENYDEETGGLFTLEAGKTYEFAIYSDSNATADLDVTFTIAKLDKVDLPEELGGEWKGWKQAGYTLVVDAAADTITLNGTTATDLKYDMDSFLFKIGEKEYSISFYRDGPTIDKNTVTLSCEADELSVNLTHDGSTEPPARATIPENLRGVWIADGSALDQETVELELSENSAVLNGDEFYATAASATSITIANDYDESFVLTYDADADTISCTYYVPLTFVRESEWNPQPPQRQDGVYTEILDSDLTLSITETDGTIEIVYDGTEYANEKREDNGSYSFDDDFGEDSSFYIFAPTDYDNVWVLTMDGTVLGYFLAPEATLPTVSELPESYRGTWTDGAASPKTLTLETSGISLKYTDPTFGFEANKQGAILAFDEAKGVTLYINGSGIWNLKLDGTTLKGTDGNDAEISFTKSGSQIDPVESVVLVDFAGAGNVIITGDKATWAGDEYAVTKDEDGNYTLTGSGEYESYLLELIVENVWFMLGFDGDDFVYPYGAYYLQGTTFPQASIIPETYYGEWSNGDTWNLKGWIISADGVVTYSGSVGNTDDAIILAYSEEGGLVLYADDNYYIWTLKLDGTTLKGTDGNGAETSFTQAGGGEEEKEVKEKTEYVQVGSDLSNTLTITEYVDGTFQIEYFDSTDYYDIVKNDDGSFTFNDGTGSYSSNFTLVKKTEKLWFLTSENAYLGIGVQVYILKDGSLGTVTVLDKYIGTWTSDGEEALTFAIEADGAIYGEDIECYLLECTEDYLILSLVDDTWTEAAWTFTVEGESLKGESAGETYTFTKADSPVPSDKIPEGFIGEWRGTGKDYLDLTWRLLIDETTVKADIGSGYTEATITAISEQKISFSLTVYSMSMNGSNLLTFDLTISGNQLVLNGTDPLWGFYTMNYTLDEVAPPAPIPETYYGEWSGRDDYSNNWSIKIEASNSFLYKFNTEEYAPVQDYTVGDDGITFHISQRPNSTYRIQLNEDGTLTLYNGFWSDGTLDPVGAASDSIPEAFIGTWTGDGASFSTYTLVITSNSLSAGVDPAEPQPVEYKVDGDAITFYFQYRDWTLTANGDGTLTLESGFNSYTYTKKEVTPPAPTTPDWAESGTGDKFDPYILKDFTSEIEVEIQARDFGDGYYSVYFEYTPKEDGEYTFTTENTELLVYYTGDEEYWGVEEIPTISLTAGTTYSFHITGDPEDEDPVSFTLIFSFVKEEEEETVTIDSAYEGIWIALYTLDIDAENGTISLNGDAATEIAKSENGYTFVVNGTTYSIGFSALSGETDPSKLTLGDEDGNPIDILVLNGTKINAVDAPDALQGDWLFYEDLLSAPHVLSFDGTIASLEGKSYTVSAVNETEITLYLLGTTYVITYENGKITVPAALGFDDVVVFSKAGTLQTPAIVEDIEAGLHGHVEASKVSGYYNDFYLTYTATKNGDYRISSETKDFFFQIFLIEEDGSQTCLKTCYHSNQLSVVSFELGKTYLFKISGGFTVQNGPALDLEFAFESQAPKIPAEMIGTWTYDYSWYTYTIVITEDSLKIEYSSSRGFNDYEFVINEDGTLTFEGLALDPNNFSHTLTGTNVISYSDGQLIVTTQYHETLRFTRA